MGWKIYIGYVYLCLCVREKVEKKRRRVKGFMSFSEMIEKDISKEHFGEE